VSEREAARASGMNRRLRCPSWGHVLYLAADDAVRGPTCVWEQGEGVFLEDTASGAVSDASLQAPVKQVTVVPAVPGRVLRFRGDMLHSVPRPALRYLLTDDSSEEPTDGEEEDEVFEDDDADDDDDEMDDEFDSIERAVVLFNTWSEPPLDGTGSNKKNSDDWSLDYELEGVQDDYSCDTSAATEETTNAAHTENSCQPHLWSLVEATTNVRLEQNDASPAPEESRIVLGVPLLGDRFRRGRAANALVLLAPRRAAEAAMLSAAQPYYLPLVEVSGE